MLVSVRERVPETPECQLRSSGCEDKEFLEDFSESIERPRRSLPPSIIISTLLLRVTNSRTRPFLSSPSTRWSKRRSSRRNLKSKETPEESRPLRRKPRETTERLSLWVLSRTNQRLLRNEHLLSVWKLTTKTLLKVIYLNWNDIYSIIYLNDLLFALIYWKLKNRHSIC